MKKDYGAKDYIINDQDGYNWVALTKPLSAYTQVELAEHLVNVKNETGSNQRIRIGGRVGAQLSTQGCDTKEDFLTKYSAILDAAGLERGSDVKEEVAEEAANDVVVEPTISVKPLSKASISDYTQEELAHLIMDDKKENQDFVVKYHGVDFSSVGLNSVQEFIDKYQEEFYKLRVKTASGNLANKPVQKEVNEPILEQQVEVPEVLDAVDKKVTNNLVDTEVLDEADQEDIETSFSSVDHIDILPLFADMIDKKTKYGKDITVEYNGITLSTENCATHKDILEKYRDVVTEYENNRVKELLKDPEIEKARIIFAMSRGNFYNGMTEEDHENSETMAKLEREYQQVYAKHETIDFSDTKQVCDWLDELVPYFNSHALSLNPGLNASDLSPVNNLLNLFGEHGYGINIIDEANMTDYYRYSITKRLAELDKYKFFISDYKETSKRADLNSAKTEAMVSVAFLQKRLKMGRNGINLIDKDLEELKVAGDDKIAKLQRTVDMIDFAAEPEVNKIAYYENAAKTDAEKSAVAAYKVAVEDPTVENTMIVNNEINKILEENPDSLLATQLRQSSIFGIGYDRTDAPKLSANDEQLALKQRCLEIMEEVRKNQTDAEQRLEDKKQKILAFIGKINEIIDDYKEKYKLDEMQKSMPVLDMDDDQTFEEAINAEKDQFDLNLEGTTEKKGFFDKLKEKFTKKEEPSEFDLNLDDQEDGIEYVSVDDLVPKANKEPEIDMTVNTEVAPAKDEVVEEAVSETNESVEEINDSDEYDFSLPDTEDSLHQFVPVRSFKKINKELYEKINNSKVKEYTKKAIEKLKEYKKAACVCLAVAGVVAIGIVAGSQIKNNNSNDVSEEPETTMDTETETQRVIEPIEEAVDNLIAEDEVDTLEDTTTVTMGGNSTAVVDTTVDNNIEAETNVDTLEASAPEVSLEDVTANIISSVVNDNSKIYSSAADALTETNGMNAYKASWENAQGGSYYAQNEDGALNKVDEQTALDYYNNGNDLVRSIENDGTIIGYVPLDNQDSGKTM